MKTKITLPVIAMAALNLFAATPDAGADQKPLKVLMIGNSFSICVVKHTPRIAKNLGCELHLCSLFIPGCPLSKHAANLKTDKASYSVSWNYRGNPKIDAVPTALKEALVHPKDKKTGKEKPGWQGNLRRMIAADKWDIVTIQQASPASWRWGTYQPFADELIAAIRELAPQAEIRIQQTWSYNKADTRICNRETGGNGSWGIDRRGMYERLTECYKKLAAANGIRIIPVGLAVENYRVAAKIDTWRNDVVGNIKVGKGGKPVGDAIHLNGSGHYLQGLVWTGALFGVDVTKCTYAPKGMDPERAELLRTCAAAAVAEGGRPIASASITPSQALAQSLRR